MNVHELPMIIFTVVAQMSIGAFWALGAIQLLGRLRRINVRDVDAITDVAMYAVGPLLVAGFIAAFFHLNDPFHAIYTMNHLGSSWLSRELIFGVLFGGAGFVFALVQWFNLLSRTLRDALAVIVSLFGLGLLISMSGVYYATVTVPAWNTFAVVVFFFASALLTGPLGVAVALLVRWGKDPVASVKRSEPRELAQSQVSLVRESLQWLTGTAAVAGVVILATYPLYLLYLAQTNNATRHVAQEISGPFLAVRLLLLGGAVVIAGVFAFARAKLSRAANVALVSLIVLALVLAFASEIMGRSLHYDGLWHAGLNTWQLIGD
ncbi:dimethyl sulfoxide reductase anchor subunit family protein [Arcanobacterium canis]